MELSPLRNTPTRPALIVTVALLLSGGVVLGTAAPAVAHDALVSSYPGADATVSGSPAEITLSFSGQLLTDGNSAVIEVIDPDGQNIAIDAPAVTDTTVTQHLTPDSPDGVFTVRWKVASSDGHPISGEYSYTVAPLAADPTTPTPTVTATPAPTPTPSATEAATSGTTDIHGTPVGGGAVFPVLAVVIGVGVVGAALIITLMAGRDRRARDRAEAAAAAAKGTSDV